MAKKGTLTGSYDALPWIVKILLQIFFGWIIGGVYRLIRFTETKNTLTLVVGLLALFTGVGNAIAEVVDLITTILANRISVFAD